MTVFAGSAVLAGEAKAAVNSDVLASKRLEQSDKVMLRSRNASVALTSGAPALYGLYSRLTLYVSAGPSNVSIKTADGNTVTLSALATGTLLDLDVQFYSVTWTGSATAVAFYTE